MPNEKKNKKFFFYAGIGESGTITFTGAAQPMLTANIGVVAVSTVSLLGAGV